MFPSRWPSRPRPRQARAPKGRWRAVRQRTCTGCGRKADQAELVRFVARDGRLVPGHRAPGRGAYTCRRLSCFERAVGRRAFNRTLRQTVRVEPELARIYTGGNNG